MEGTPLSENATGSRVRRAGRMSRIDGRDTPARSSREEMERARRSTFG